MNGNAVVGIGVFKQEVEGVVLDELVMQWNLPIPAYGQGLLRPGPAIRVLGGVVDQVRVAQAGLVAGNGKRDPDAWRADFGLEGQLRTVLQRNLVGHVCRGAGHAQVQLQAQFSPAGTRLEHDTAVLLKWLAQP